MFDLSLFRTPLASAPPTLEQILCGREYFGLETASNLQIALCRIIDGLPLGDLANDESVIRSLGGADAISNLPRRRPKEIVLLAGIRSGKSLIAAAIAVRAALTCDVSRLGPGEVPRVSILSLTRDTAAPTWAHVHGRITASPTLSSLLVGAPKADSLQLRHPTGRPVEICVVAGRRAAGTLVARWSAGNIFDEAPRMVGEEDGVVNLDHARASIAGRLLPGAQVVMSGSAWAPFGPVYDLIAEHHGKPSANMVTVRARGDDMNPAIWTPEACAELRARDPDAYSVDIDCNFLDPESGLLGLGDLESSADRPWVQLPACHGYYYTAAIDPATRGNAWTLIILGRNRTGRLFVCDARQWIGSVVAPLSPTDVFTEIAEILRPYGVTQLYTDQWAADALVEIATSRNLWLISEAITAPRKLEMFTELAAKVADRSISLPSYSELLRDLASVRKRVTSAGVSIHFPRTGDGRHCDYAPALALAVAHAPRLPDPEPAFDTRTEAGIAAELKERIRREVEARNREVSRVNRLRTGWGKR